MIPRRSRRHQEEVISDLEFADDIALLSNSAVDSQSQLDALSLYAAQVGLQISVKKTEVLTRNINHSGVSMQAYGEEIKHVPNFKYLGSLVANSEDDIRTRKGKAWVAFWKLERIWKSQSLPLEMKLRLFDASCLSILLYGCESWTISESQASSLNSFATSCFRIMLGYKRMDKVTNKHVLEIVHRPVLIDMIHKRQLGWLGHALRREPQELVCKYALFTPSHGHRQRGGNKTLFHQYIGKVISPTIPPSSEEIRNAALDRNGWRSLVTACCGQPPG